MILSAVHMVYRLVNSTYDVKELCLRLTRLLCQFIHADSSSVYIIDPQKKRIILLASFDNKINIFVNQKNDLSKIVASERRVGDGYPLVTPHVIGLPLVADDNIGAVFVRRKTSQPAFSDFDREMLSVVAEQAVTAIRALQVYEREQRVTLESIKFIGMILKRHGRAFATADTSVFFRIVRAIAEKVGLSEVDIDNLYYASVLRGAGADDLPYDILAKKSQLTPEEFKIIQEQPTRSVALIRPVDFLKPVLPILLYHHEKYDGSGYPSGLKREQIPLGARVMAVAEAFEAMTGDRPYKRRLSVDDALDEIQRNSGTQFDPRVVSVFIALSRQKKFRKNLSLTKK